MAPAFRLRKATLDDFSTYYNLRLDLNYHWLLFDPIEKDEPASNESTENSFEDNFFFSKEDAERIHNERIGFNEKDFTNYLNWFRIFMVIVKNECVGYVRLEKYQSQFIVREWPMKLEFRDTDLLEEILKKIESMQPKSAPRMRIVAWNDSAKDFLNSHKYQKGIMPFYDKQSD